LSAIIDLKSTAAVQHGRRTTGSVSIAQSSNAL